MYHHNKYNKSIIASLSMPILEFIPFTFGKNTNGHYIYKPIYSQRVWKFPIFLL